MLWTIVIILLLLWVLGFGTGIHLGGLLHVLLIVVIVVVIYQLLTGRRPPL